MAKLSIHIQDNVLEKIKPYKDMINISKVCANALLKEVNLISNVPREVKNMQELILRLRDDVNGKKRESFDLGLAMARLYTNKMTFEELKYWGTRNVSSKEKYYFPEEVEDKLEKYLLEKNEGNSFDRNAFVQGWVSITKKTWECVKNKV